MGNQSSKKKQKKDDECIGNRRVRTIILSIILAAFMIFAAPYLFDVQDAASIGYENNIIDSEYIDDIYYSTSLIVSGLVITLVGCVCAVVLFFIPNCEDNLGRVAGFILVVGGLLYIIGWIWYAVLLNNPPDVLGISVPGIGDEYMWALIGEALLGGVSAILLGLDAAFHFYENEAKRLSANLGLLMTVSSLCMGAYYAAICAEDDLLCIQRDGVEAIATGYAIIFITALVYIILYIFTCCTCDCKDTCLVRVVIAVALVVGGVLAAIGYYVYSGGYEEVDVDSEGNVSGEFVAYYIGYTILIGGTCVVWALDMAFDDFKNR